MKKLLSLFIIFIGLIPFNFSQTYDDIYYSPKDNDTIKDTVVVNNNYITNNYYDYDNYDDDNSEYIYTSRIRRFHSDVYYASYFSPYYTNMYWYSYDPWDWGMSIYIGYGWYYPTYYYRNWYGWNRYNWHWPYNYYSHNNYNYWFGYNNGFWNGYNYGYWDGYNYGSYYNWDNKYNSKNYGHRELSTGNNRTNRNVSTIRQGDVKNSQSPIQNEIKRDKTEPQPYSSPRYNKPRLKNEYISPSYRKPFVVGESDKKDKTTKSDGGNYINTKPRTKIVEPTRISTPTRQSAPTRTYTPSRQSAPTRTYTPSTPSRQSAPTRTYTPSTPSRQSAPTRTSTRSR